MEGEILEEALRFAAQHRSDYFRADGSAVEIGKAGELDDEQRERLLKYLRCFAPWRKGPFRLFGETVDANWRSDLRWERVSRWLDRIADRDVADVGCNNGYYLLRMAATPPRFLLGLDPVPVFFNTFRFLQAFHPFPFIRFEPCGYDRLLEYPKRFDVILCLGVLYHHPEPLAILRTMREALRPGGQLVIESLALPPPGLTYPGISSSGLSSPGMSSENSQVGSLALFPRGKYAGAGGIWFVPTPECLQNWLWRSGYRDVELRETYSGRGEMQRTPYSELPVLEDSIDPDDSSRTVEGYPLPIRLVITARR